MCKVEVSLINAADALERYLFATIPHNHAVPWSNAGLETSLSNQFRWLASLLSPDVIYIYQSTVSRSININNDQLTPRTSLDIRLPLSTTYSTGVIMIANQMP